MHLDDAIKTHTLSIFRTSVKRDNQWSARLKLSVRNSSGQSERKEVTVRQDRNLSLPKLSNNPIYEGIRITEFNLSTDGMPGSIELNSHGVIKEGEAMGELPLQFTEKCCARQSESISARNHNCEIEG